MQEAQHSHLMKVLIASNDTSQQVINQAVSQMAQKIISTNAIPPQHIACPSQPQALFSADNGFEEVEGEDEGPISDEEDDTDAWDFPASGNISPPPSKDAPSCSKQEDDIQVDQDLFNMYGLPVNWTIAPELGTWMKSVTNKEVPFSVLKQINESLVPSEDLQPLFTAPALPLTISKLLYTAPKSLSRGPKFLNNSLLRVQRELCIGYKPIVEVLNFYYSESCTSLTAIIPDLKDIFARQKLLLSQGLATMISASLRVSKARKQALRPIVKYSSSGILQHQPTSQHVLGSGDLASLADKANKENRALSGVFFRQGSRIKLRYKAQYQPYNRNFRYQYNRRFQGGQYGYQNYQNSNRRYPRTTRPKKGLANSSANK